MARNGRPLTLEHMPRRKPEAEVVILIDKKTLTKRSPIFEVFDRPVILRLYGATTQAVHIYSVYGPQYNEKYALLRTDLVSSNNSILISETGRYQAVLVGELTNSIICTYQKQIVLSNQQVAQPSGVQANRPNLFFDENKYVNPSQVIEIANDPWIFFAYGLEVGDEIQILMVHEDRQEIFRFNGVEHKLTAVKNSIRLEQSGRYRFLNLSANQDIVLVGNPTFIGNSLEILVISDLEPVDQSGPGHYIVDSDIYGRIIGKSLNSYVHQQNSASDTWIINHNLNRKVSVQAFTMGGSEILTEIIHINDNQTFVLFDQLIAGYAIAQ